MFAYKDEDEVINAALHIMESKPMIVEPMQSVDQVCSYFKLRLSNAEREIFSVMFLNNQHCRIATEDVFFGTIDGAAVYPREIAKLALRYNAAAVVLAHNHPSGTVEPSEADKRITLRILEALGLLDVRVIDHIIVSQQATTSFAVRGLL